MIKQSPHYRFNRTLIENCSPTLARLKTANLFTLSFSSRQELDACLLKWNSELNEKGVFLTVLRKYQKRALIYVYRQSKLQSDLMKKGVSEFLSQYGYRSCNARYAIQKLRERFTECGDFPHEIGLFLSYPLGDVKGFIDHRGQNCKCAGCWKVYEDETMALRLFAQYKKCKDIYLQCFQNGFSLAKLTVA